MSMLCLMVRGKKRVAVAHRQSSVIIVNGEALSQHYVTAIHGPFDCEHVQCSGE
jgi:hypothetical protein